MGNSRHFCIWSMYMVSIQAVACNFYTVQLYLHSWVDWVTFHNFAKKTTSLEYQKTVISAHNILHYFFYSRRASFSCWKVVFLLLLDWMFYNFKNFKFNGSGNLFERRHRRLLVRLLVTLSKLLTLPLQ